MHLQLRCGNIMMKSLTCLHSCSMSYSKLFRGLSYAPAPVLEKLHFAFDFPASIVIEAKVISISKHKRFKIYIV